jgi:hypothetical protein
MLPLNSSGSSGLSDKRGSRIIEFEHKKTSFSPFTRKKKMGAGGGGGGGGWARQTKKINIDG